MPQFDYQQLCHFVLPEQGGLSVETILKRFLHLTPREIRHAKYIPDGIQKNGVSCRTNAVVQTESLVFDGKYFIGNKYTTIVYL